MNGESSYISTDIADDNPAWWADFIFSIWIILIHVYYSFQFTNYSLKHIHREITEIQNHNKETITQAETQKEMIRLTTPKASTKKQNSNTTDPENTLADISKHVTNHQTNNFRYEKNKDRDFDNNKNASEDESLSENEMANKTDTVTIKTRTSVHVVPLEVASTTNTNNTSPRKFKKEDGEYELNVDYVTLARPLKGRPNQYFCCCAKWSPLIFTWSRTKSLRIFLQLYTVFACSLALIMWLEFFFSAMLEVCFAGGGSAGFV